MRKLAQSLFGLKSCNTGVESGIGCSAHEEVIINLSVDIFWAWWRNKRSMGWRVSAGHGMLTLSEGLSRERSLMRVGIQTNMFSVLHTPSHL